MKTLILICLACVVHQYTMAQKYKSNVFLNAVILSIDPQPAEQHETEYEIKIKILNTSGDSVLQGDTILISAREGNDIYTISTYVAKSRLARDSSMVITINEIFESGSFDKSGMMMRHDYSASFKRGMTKTVTYTALVDIKKHFPWLDLYVPMMRLTDIEFYSALSQLNFKYYGTKSETLKWILSDNNGRSVSHGFLNIRKGINAYMITADNLRSGRYTLTIGDGSDEMDGTFTVIR